MRKKLLSILVLLSLTVSSAWADVVASGDCGISGLESYVTWSLTDDGTLTVSGTGAMANYASKGAPWYSYCSSITSIVIGDDVTSIGDEAFWECYNLESVTIGNSVTSIGECIFQSCSNLSSVTIGNSVTSISQGAFFECTKLSSVTIPDGVTSIGDYAFYSCSNLTTVTIPDGVKSIGEDAFSYCSSLTTVIVYAPECTLGESAFDYSGLTHIYVPSDKVTDYQGADNWHSYESIISAIVLGSGYCGDPNVNDGKNVTWSLTDDRVMTVSGTGAMADYEDYDDMPWYSHKDDITSVVIEDGMTTIGDYAFRECYDLTSLTVGNDVTSIGNNAFYYCDILSSVTFGSSLTSIGEFAFGYCAITTLDFPNSVTLIDKAAFSGCKNLISVTIAGNEKYGTKIAHEAFSCCDNLTTVTIGNGVRNIRPYAFGGASSLEKFFVYSESVDGWAFGGSDGEEGVFEDQDNFTIYVFSNLVNDFKNSTHAGETRYGWIFYADKIEAIPDEYLTVSGVTANQDPKNTSNYWCTYFNPLANVKINTEDVQIFTVSLSGDELTLTDVTSGVIKSGQPVVLKATAGGELDMELTDETTYAFDGISNDLKGTSFDMTGAAGNIYVLNAKTDTGAGFYKLSSGGTIGANKAYLVYSGGTTGGIGGGSQVREFFLFDEATAIDMPAVESNDADAVVYDLQGRRVVNPTKGLYIVNGKKVIINK